MFEKIEVISKIFRPLEVVYEAYNHPDDVTKWNHASDNWHSPHAENDLRVGGSFKYRMEAKDGSFGFDFGGVYDVVSHDRIVYHMSDGREVEVKFKNYGDYTIVHITFDAEKTNPIDLQKEGWQSILDNFKRYVETYK